ncbi:hypothetical protein Lfu02_33670 [Longispora fulva]|uniref:DUF4386 domain-containing protein n=1 Tax=Longispora fulva TaxID=619741 RepID=A0A8J7GLF8_9ACTN|nr:DUF4386 domain-containing protein [Longispora fulva]MBG6141849.1 hypothetical protein [Longispora fulva]GIG58995.1 hypothetical protein Lfu02_33670 [Longispora fulva]
MSSLRRSALVVGVLFLVTEIAAIAGLVLYQPVLKDANYVLGAGADTRVLLGALCELVLVAAVIGTAAAVYPVVRRQRPAVALGYVCVRLLEAVIIVVGVLSVLAVVSLRRDPAGTDDDALATVAHALVALHDWTFLLGPNVALGANSLLLAYLLYRSRLVPRFIAVLGLVGGPLILASATAVMFGLYEQVSPVGSLAALPVFAWEVSLAGYLLVKGFRQAAASEPPVRQRELSAV